MINWIYERKGQEINSQIKLNMVTLTKDLQEKAVTSHVGDYRRCDKNNVNIRFNEYKTQVDLGMSHEKNRKSLITIPKKRIANLPR